MVTLLSAIPVLKWMVFGFGNKVIGAIIYKVMFVVLYLI